MNQISTETDRPDAPMRGWLKALNGAVRNPLSREDMAMRLPAIELACQGFPPAAWNRDTLRAAIERFQFWPSAGEICAVLGEWTREQKPVEERMGGTSIGRAVERISGPKTAPKTEAEIAYVEQRRAAISAELRQLAREKAGTASPPSPSYGTPRDLVVQHSRTEGGRAAIRMQPGLSAVAREMAAESGYDDMDEFCRALGKAAGERQGSARA